MFGAYQTFFMQTTQMKFAMPVLNRTKKTDFQISGKYEGIAVLK